MKRLLAIALVVVMVLGATATGYAAPKWGAGGGLPPGIQKQVTLALMTTLKDLDMVPWAKNAMEKMAVKGIIKGYNDNTFRPNQAVTKLEAVVLALRIMGWEEKAKNTFNLPSKYKGGKLDPWAIGYVSIAYEKGILDEVDMIGFNPNEAAKRWEVAKYVVRALGYEDKAEEHMNDKLKFKDYKAIPVGAVGYVYVINDLGLMVGNADGTFNPNKAVSRAEMAVLMERIDDKVDSDVDENEDEGTIVDIDYDDYEFTLDIDGDEVDYKAIDGIAVYYDGGYIDFDRLKEGNIVKVLKNSEGKVIFIELKDRKVDKLIADFRGEVRDLDLDDREITIKSGTAIFIFQVKTNADIEVNGKDADLEDVMVGDIVRLKVDDRNRVIKIEAEGDRKDVEKVTEEVEGTIYAITTGNVRGITVKLDSGRLRTYSVTRNTEITIDGKDAALSDLSYGMEVKVKVVDGEAVEIDAEPVPEPETKTEGVIYRVDDNRIRVRTGKTYATFSIDKNTDIEVDGKDADVDDLMVDMEVVVTARGGVATKIEAESLISQAEGVISSLSDNGDRIRVKVGSSYKIYYVNDETDIEIDGKDADYDDLVVNMEVTVSFRGDTAIAIAAKSLKTEVTGVITDINVNRNRITVKVGEDSRVFDIEGAEIYIDGQRTRVRNLKPGMEVKLTLTDDRHVDTIEVE